MSNIPWPLDEGTVAEACLDLCISCDGLKSPWEFGSAVQSGLDQQITRQEFHPACSIDPSASIQGNVWIGPGAKILGNATVIGPTYIGAGAIIGHGSLIRHSYVGTRTIAGFVVDIARSFIANGCWLSRAHIADSVLCAEVSVGGGTVFASLKTNGKDVAVKDDKSQVLHIAKKLGAVVGSRTLIGAGALIMPGITIGQSCVVGPAVVLQRPLKDGRLIYVEQQLTEKEMLSSYADATRDIFRQKLDSEIRLQGH